MATNRKQTPTESKPTIPTKNGHKVRQPISPNIDEVNLDQLIPYNNTSKKIRALAANGYKPGDIERIFERVGVTTRDGHHIRYQHIRNVLHTVLSNPEPANDNPTETMDTEVAEGTTLSPQS